MCFNVILGSDYLEKKRSIRCDFDSHSWKKHYSELTAMLYKTISVLLSDEWVLPAGLLSCIDIDIAARGLEFVP